MTLKKHYVRYAIRLHLCTLYRVHTIMSAVGTIFSILISIICIGVVIWIVLYPEPIKNVLTIIYPYPEYDMNENATKSDKTILYSSPNSKHDKLVVLFIGGGGIFSDVSNAFGFANKLNENLGEAYDILMFEYPVRFKYTIQESMLAINKILADYIHYESVHAIGISFGSLLAGAFYQKESLQTKAEAMKVPQIGIKFKTLSIFSGVLECTFNVEVLTRLFHFYIMKDTPGLINYTCYGIPIPKYIVSAKTDFLIAQTAKFLQTESSEYKIYSTPTLPHAFCQLINLDDALDAIKGVSTFIQKY
nr:gp19-like protein [Oryctes rhinoceros nudivirus]